MPDEPLCGSFHAFALAAYVIVAAETGQWPPDSEKVRRMAYDFYERRGEERDLGDTA